MADDKESLETIASRVNARISATTTTPDIEPGAGADILQRAMVSFPRTPEGRMQMLQAVLAKGYTAETIEGGELAVRSPDGKLRLLDPEEFEWADLADILGDLPPIFGGMGAGLAGLGGGGFSAIPFGAAGAAAGDVFSRGIGQQFLEAQGGGSEGEPLVGRSTAEEAMYGAAPEIGLRVLSGATKLPVRGFAKWFRDRGAGSPSSVKVLEDMTTVGADPSKLPPSAQSSSKLVQMVEQNMRTQPSSEMMMEGADQAMRKELLDALERTRDVAFPVSKAAKGYDWPLKTNLSSGDIEEGLMEEVVRNRDTAETMAKHAFKEMTEILSPDTPMAAPKLTAWLENWWEQLERTPSLKKGAIQNVVGLLEDVYKKNTLGDLDDLRKTLGETVLKDKATYGNYGRWIYKRLLEDIDDGFEALNTPEAMEAATKWKHYRNLFHWSFKLDESLKVKQIFGDTKIPDPAKIDDAAKRLFEQGSKDQIIKFKMRIGAEDTPSGVKATEKGKLLWEMMKNLEFDRIIRNSTREVWDPDAAIINGNSFMQKMFETTLGEDKVRLIYGNEAAERFRALGRLLSNTTVAQRFYGNFSNTELQRAISQMIDPKSWIFAIPTHMGRRAAGAQFAKSQGKGAYLGKEFFTEGKMPKENILMGAIKGSERIDPLMRIMKAINIDGPNAKKMVRLAKQQAITHGTTRATISRKDLPELNPGSAVMQPGGRILGK